MESKLFMPRGTLSPNPQIYRHFQKKTEKEVAVPALHAGGPRFNLWQHLQRTGGGGSETLERWCWCLLTALSWMGRGSVSGARGFLRTSSHPTTRGLETLQSSLSTDRDHSPARVLQSPCVAAEGGEGCPEALPAREPTTRLLGSMDSTASKNLNWACWYSRWCSNAKCCTPRLDSSSFMEMPGENGGRGGGGSGEGGWWCLHHSGLGVLLGQGAIELPESLRTRFGPLGLGAGGLPQTTLGQRVCP